VGKGVATERILIASARELLICPCMSASLSLGMTAAHLRDLISAPLSCRFFEWLHVDCPYNNTHNIRLCRLAVKLQVVSPSLLAELGACVHAVEVLAYAHENGVEPFIEASLELLLSLLETREGKMTG
jgi:hypothetical protein